MLSQLKTVAAQLKQEFEVYRLVLKHPETPMVAKFFLGLAIGYVLMPFDLIPDFIPLIGQLDDLVIVPLLVYIAIKIIPDGLVSECRELIKREKTNE
ncbi:YkvA family protein [Candidatus Methylopumilus turicensis]|jgi:uncharacterized membrane protein YkvA (DUF1232 family)|uniref:DUF1232 domain-containing protein n=1 Tax=Candidatus Methylopumilus turicensis TaxID=1581680 RepID=A0A0B7IZL0_9PROT|nr:YkvA family protein [Candidatus Methylopumilus turicensis]CEN56545.1 conserved protein of unknown function [Candidatus Methylopumilus turicensis]